MKIKLLGIGFEYRPFYTYVLVNSPKLKSIRLSTIILYGHCNLQCIYCKRDGYFRAGDGSIISSKDYELSVVLKFIENQKNKKPPRMVRISGGDPIAMPLELLTKIAVYTHENGIPFSIATNMTVPSKVEKMLEHVDYLAGDFKAPARYWETATLSPLSVVEKVRESWRVWAENFSVEAEARIPVFPFTEFADVAEILDFLASLPRMPIIVFRAFRRVQWLDWESTSPQHIMRLARAVSREYSIPVIVRIKWKTGTLLVKPDGDIEDVTL